MTHTHGRQPKPLAILGFITLSVMLLCMLFAGCASNQQSLDEFGVDSFATGASSALMDSVGKQVANYQGVAPTMLKQDDKGNWITTPGPGGSLTYNATTNDVYIWSPKDAILEDPKFTPQPEPGEPIFQAKRIELNISDPAKVYADQYAKAMEAIQGMTVAEAERRVKEMQAVGQITGDVAQVLLEFLSKLEATSLIGSPLSVNTPWIWTRFC